MARVGFKQWRKNTCHIHNSTLLYTIFDVPSFKFISCISWLLEHNLAVILLISNNFSRVSPHAKFFNIVSGYKRQNFETSSLISWYWLLCYVFAALTFCNPVENEAFRIYFQEEQQACHGGVRKVWENFPVGQPSTSPADPQWEQKLSVLQEILPKWPSTQAWSTMPVCSGRNNVRSTSRS